MYDDDPMTALVEADVAEDWERAAVICERDLHDHERAVAYWQHVLAREPGHGAALDALERLFSYDHCWPQLVELLEQRAAIASEAAERAVILAKLAALHREVLADEDRAAAIDAQLAELRRAERR